MDASLLNSIASRIDPSTLASMNAMKSPGEPPTVLSFKDLLYQQLSDANAQYARTQQSIDSLLNGNLDNIHNVVLESAKAELSLQMMLEMRNRITEQYQELMRMQI